MSVRRAAFVMLSAFLGVLQLVVASPAQAGVTSQEPAHRGEIAGYPDLDQKLGTIRGRGQVFMVGDSITYRAHNTRLRRSRPTWEITAVPGRDVSTLPYYLADRVRAKKSPLSTVVVALGTNATQNWTYERLRDTLKMVPPTTRVVLVTTWRSTASSPETRAFRSRASSQSTYSRWMTTLDRIRPHTCLADWRAQVSDRPWLAPDGVHPAGAAGWNAWSAVVTNAVRTCT